MNDLRILIVIDSLGAGGAEKSTQVLCDYLHDNNIYFEIICLDKKKVGVQDNMINKGYKITFINHLSFLKQVDFISKYITLQKFCVVHSILFRSNIRVRLCRLRSRFTHMESLVNTTYAESRYSDPKVNKYSLRAYWLLDRLTINRYVDHFHSVTETVKNHYVKKLGLAPEKVSVIYRGRDAVVPEKIACLKEFGFSENDFVVVTTGRHEYQKAQIQLIKAFSEVVKKGYTNIKLLVLGREGQSTPEMKEYITKNNLQNHICLAGYRNNVPEILPSCQLFAFPSYYEGLGGAIIEAQAASLPIICNDIEVLREVVKIGKNAQLFDSKKPYTIADNIIALYESESLRKEYRVNSRKNFEVNFELQAINKKMLTLYQQLCTQ